MALITRLGLRIEAGGGVAEVDGDVGGDARCGGQDAAFAG
jgi:hypothetical protein